MRYFWSVLGIAAAFALGACDSGSSNPNLASGNSAEQSGNDEIRNANHATEAKDSAEETIRIQTMAGSPKEKATLLPTKTSVDLTQIAQAVRGSDYNCKTALAARQLRQNGKDLDIFKIDCSGGHSYQITMMDGQTFYKPWTGVVFGN